MKKKVLLVLAEGFEEIEAVTPLDILRRAGLDVTLAGVGGLDIMGAHGLCIKTDVKLEDYSEVPDAVVLPGGMPGAKNLAGSKTLGELLKKMNTQERVIGAICAAPGMVLAKQGILDGRKATCYPGFENNFGQTTTFLADRVVTDGHVITSRGPGSAMEFALSLARRLAGARTAGQLTEGMLVKAD